MLTSGFSHNLLLIWRLQWGPDQLLR